MNIDFDFEKYPELRIFTKSFNVADYDPFHSPITSFSDKANKYKNEFIPFFQNNVPKDNIHYFSTPIYTEIFKSGNKFRSDEVYKHYCETVSAASGIFVSGPQSYIYYFEPTGYIDTGGRFAVSFDNAYVATFFSGRLMAFAQTSGVDPITKLPLTKGFTLIPDSDLIDLVADVLVMNIFLKYVEIQEKKILGREKTKSQQIKFKNSTPLAFKYITSNYFTNLQRTGAFGVKGHWRLQRYGTGLKEVKLIWIDEFLKKGYSRTADKIRWNK